MTKWLLVPGAIVAGGVMVGVGFAAGDDTVRNAGIGVATFGLLLGATLQSMRQKNN